MPEKPARTRAELLPEEERVGSADASTQAELILEESELRTWFPEKDEHRTSDEATPPS